MKYFKNFFIIIIFVIVSGLFIVRQGEFYVEDFKVVYQEIDNTNSLSAWIIGYNAVVEDDYVLLVNDNEDVRTSPADLKVGTDYTILVNVLEYTGTTSNSSFGISWFNNPFEDTNELGIILYSVNSGVTTGITKTLITSTDPLEFYRTKFSANWGASTDEVKFRAVLLEGDWTGITDELALDLIENAEFGDFEYDDSYYYTDDLTMDTRIENIIPIFFGLMVIVILGSIGFSLLKRN